MDGEESESLAWAVAVLWLAELALLLISLAFFGGSAAVADLAQLQTFLYHLPPSGPLVVTLRLASAGVAASGLVVLLRAATGRRPSPADGATAALGVAHGLAVAGSMLLPWLVDSSVAATLMLLLTAAAGYVLLRPRLDLRRPVVD